MYNVTRKWEDIATDFPTNGVVLNDIITYLVTAPANVTVTVQITMDGKDKVDTDTAVWVDHATVLAGTHLYEVMEYCPNGMKFVATVDDELTPVTPAMAWIKS